MPVRLKPDTTYQPVSRFPAALHLQWRGESMTRLCTTIALASFLTVSIAAAQEPPPAVTLMPASSSRWDATAHVTWLGEWRPEPSIQWDPWFNVASGGGIVGYYWTPHLKTEFDLSTSTEGERYSVEPIALPGNTTVLPLQRDHEFRVTTASVGVIGQFFDNAWFHPFVGAGLELIREREHIETSLQIFLPRDPRAPASIPDFQPETFERYRARPYAATGFKAYVSERAFIRTDIRTSWSSDGLGALAWRGGVGFDF